MNVFCLVPSRDGTSHTVYAGNPKWPAVEDGYLRPAYPQETENGQSTWIVFDRMGRPFTGESPEAALDTFALRPIYRNKQP